MSKAKLDLGKFLSGGRAAQQAVDDAIAAHGRERGGSPRCCELKAPHCHCQCGYALPAQLVALGERVPRVGDTLMVIPGNFVVRCPSCNDSTLVRVAGKGSSRS